MQVRACESCRQGPEAGEPRRNPRTLGREWEVWIQWSTSPPPDEEGPQHQAALNGRGEMITPGRLLSEMPRRAPPEEEEEGGRQEPLCSPYARMRRA